MQWPNGSREALWAIVAAVVAAGIALLAVWLSNKNSRRQLAMQLLADKQQRERDRNMAVRRDVYIPAAGAISRIQTMVRELADFSTDHSVLSRSITSDMASLAKVSVLGTDATVAAISRLTAASMHAYLQLTAMRQKLMQRHGKLRTALAARDAAVNQRRQIGELLHQALRSGNNDPTLLRRLQTQFEGDAKAVEARQEEAERLMEEHADEERELHLRILEMDQKVLKYVPDALIAVRRELELPVNEAALRRMFAEQQAAALEVGRRLLEHAGVTGKSPEATPVSDEVMKEARSPSVPEELLGKILAEEDVASSPLGPSELH